MKERFEDLSKRQKQIIDVSIRLIAGGGIQALTIKNISGKIGVSEPALYRHFDSKQQILEGILLYFDSESSEIVEKMNDLEGDPFEKLEQFYINHITKLSENKAFSSVIFAEDYFKGDRKLTEKLKNIMEKNRETLILLLDNAKREGDISNDIDSHSLAIIILGSLRLTVKRWHHSDYSFDLVEAGREIVNTFKQIFNGG